MGLQVNYVRKWGRDFAAWRDTVGTYVPVTDRRRLRAGSHRPDHRDSPVDERPGARKFELGNSDGVFTDIHAFTREPDQADDIAGMPTRGSPICERPERSAEARRSTSIQQRSALEFSTFGRNPNDFVNLDGRLIGDVGWQDKLQGVVRLPWGFQASASLDSHESAHRLRTRSDPVVGRRAVVTTIMLQPRGDLGPAAVGHDHRCPAAEGLRARSRRSALALFLDALNLNNENAPQAVVSANVTNGPYQYPTTFVAPRRFMLSGKFSF